MLTVFIASPGDVQHQRDVAEQTVWDWNRDGRSRRVGVVLIPRRWEVDAVPRQGDDAQTQVNEQLVQDSDIVIGIFHGRLGTPTARRTSGSAEEIELTRRHALGTHVLISQAPLPRSHDPAQFAALKRYEEDLGERGLLGMFASDEELRRIIRRILDDDVDRYAEAAKNAAPDSAGPASPEIERSFDEVAQAARTGGVNDEALAKVLFRLKRTLERQALVVAKQVRYDVEVYRSPRDDYLLYDFRKVFQYIPATALVNAKLTISLIPDAMRSLLIPSPPLVTPRSNLEWKPWNIQFWPAMNDIGHWLQFVEDIEVRVSVARSDDPRSRPREVVLDRAASSDPAAPRVDFVGDIEIDETWDSLIISVARMPHARALRALHFYIGDVCVGEWRVFAKTRGPRPPFLRLTGIASSDIAIEREVLNAGVLALTYRVGKAALMPDDAVVITLNDAPPRRNTIPPSLPLEN